MGTLSARIVQDGRLIATALSSYAAERPGPDFAFPFADNIVVQERLGPAVFSAPDGTLLCQSRQMLAVLG